MMHKYVALAALLGVATSAHAGEIAPLAAESIELGSIRGIAYYTEALGGYRVVTTLADGEAGLPVRFEVTLLDRQTFTISVPGKVGEPGRALGIARVADKLVISNTLPAADKLIVTRSLDGGD